ncbi:hypothetical protein Bca4012_009698 [Brassica carinata]
MTERHSTVFDEFAHMSGQCINIAKLPSFGHSAIAASLLVSTLPIKYLGMPLTAKMMSKLDCQPLFDKIRDHFLRCQENLS